MAKITAEWDHVAEGEHHLEQWVTVVDGVALYVTKVRWFPTDLSECYVWRNSYTGSRHRTGATATLAEAMTAAIRSLLKGDS